MRPLYTYDRLRPQHIDAAEYPLKGEATHIFSVPRRSCVATNSLHNAITLLDLSQPKVSYRELTRGLEKDVRGGMMYFLPEFSNDTIGYTKTRSLVLVNVKTGRTQKYQAARFFEDRIAEVAVVDWERKLFLFALDFTQLSGSETALRLLDLSGSAPKEVALLELDKEPRYALIGKTSFYYTNDVGRLTLHAVNERLDQTPHPLLQLYNAGLFAGEVSFPVMHPSLPFAVFNTLAPPPGHEIVVWAADWRRHGQPARLTRLFDKPIDSFVFSPDGKWLLFQDWTGGREGITLGVMPVLTEAPYLGPPVILRTLEHIPEKWNGNCAWITEPASVVCTISRSEFVSATEERRPINKLLKWDLSPENIRK